VRERTGSGSASRHIKLDRRLHVASLDSVFLASYSTVSADRSKSQSLPGLYTDGRWHSMNYRGPHSSTEDNRPDESA
jgi:hypothetical protein